MFSAYRDIRQGSELFQKRSDAADPANRKRHTGNEKAFRFGLNFLIGETPPFGLGRTVGGSSRTGLSGVVSFRRLRNRLHRFLAEKFRISLASEIAPIDLAHRAAVVQAPAFFNNWSLGGLVNRGNRDRGFFWSRVGQRGEEFRLKQLKNNRMEVMSPNSF